MCADLLKIFLLLIIFKSELLSQTFLHNDSFNSRTVALGLENNQFAGLSVIPFENLNISYYNSLYQAEFQYQDFTAAARYTFFKSEFLKGIASAQTFGNFGDGFKEIYGGLGAQAMVFKRLDIAAEVYATHVAGFKTYFQVGAQSNIYKEFFLFTAYGTPFYGFKNGNVLKAGAIVRTEKLSVKTNFEWQQEERMLFARIMTGFSYTIF